MQILKVMKMNNVKQLHIYIGFNNLQMGLQGDKPLKYMQWKKGEKHHKAP